MASGKQPQIVDGRAIAAGTLDRQRILGDSDLAIYAEDPEFRRMLPAEDGDAAPATTTGGAEGPQGPETPPSGAAAPSGEAPAPAGANPDDAAAPAPGG